MVSAPVIAKERGIQISTTTQDQSGVFDGYIKVTVVTDKRERSVAGTVFSRRQAALHPDQGHQHRRRDRRAHALHHQRGRAGHHRHAGRHHGRERREHRQLHPRPVAAKGEAIALLYVDEPVPEPVLSRRCDDTRPVPAGQAADLRHGLTARSRAGRGPSGPRAPPCRRLLHEDARDRSDLRHRRHPRPEGHARRRARADRGRRRCRTRRSSFSATTPTAAPTAAACWTR